VEARRLPRRRSRRRPRWPSRPWRRTPLHRRLPKRGFTNHRFRKDIFAVNLGGDADTNGAVAGALAGARFGAGGIPQRWLEPLRRKEVVSGLANRLTRS